MDLHNIEKTFMYNVLKTFKICLINYWKIESNSSSLFFLHVEVHTVLQEEAELLKEKAKPKY